MDSWCAQFQAELRCQTLVSPQNLAQTWTAERRQGSEQELVVLPLGCSVSCSLVGFAVVHKVSLSLLAHLISFCEYWRPAYQQQAWVYHYQSHTQSLSLDNRKGVVGEKALPLLVISYCIIEWFDRDITCFRYQSILDILDAHSVLDIGDVWDDSFKPVERHSDESE